MSTQEVNLDSLGNLLGPKGLIRDPDLCRTAGQDWRGNFAGPVLAIARPETPAEAAQVVRWARETKTAIVPQGGNSSLSGGSVPNADLRPALVLSCSRLTQVREFDPQQRLLTAETGLVLEDLQNQVAPLLMPIDLGGRGSAQMGGLLACHAGGLNVVRYGSLRSQVRGLEVVLPNGEIWHGLNQVKKDNTGFDLKSLFIGSEGTLGFITAFTLQLYAPPAQKLTCLLGCESPAQALDLFLAFEPLFSGQIYAAELMPRIGLERALAQFPNQRNPFGSALPPFALLLEFGLRESLVEAEEALVYETLERFPLDAAIIAQNQSQRADIWGLREGIVLAQKAYGPSLKHDVCVPLSQVSALLSQGMEVCAKHMPGCIPVPFGHLGDGSFHFNVSYPAPYGPEAEVQAKALTRALHDLVHSLGGSISAEHGVGQARRDEVARLRDPIATQTMQSLKQALDPAGLFNPGKVLSG